MLFCILPLSLSLFFTSLFSQQQLEKAAEGVVPSPSSSIPIPVSPARNATVRLSADDEDHTPSESPLAASPSSSSGALPALVFSSPVGSPSSSSLAMDSAQVRTSSTTGSSPEQSQVDAGQREKKERDKERESKESSSATKQELEKVKRENSALQAERDTVAAQLASLEQEVDRLKQQVKEAQQFCELSSQAEQEALGNSRLYKQQVSHV